MSENNQSQGQTQTAPIGKQAKVVATIVVGIFIFFAIMALSSEDKTNEKIAQEQIQPTSQKAEVATPTATNTDVQKAEDKAKADQEKAAAEKAAKEKAQKELDDVIALSKKAGLVKSYEFSDKANVVYVNKMWYTQDVSFKKDFLAKIASLKTAITGYHRFEVRDAYSNEKVAEVTAFSGSLEVYK